VNTRCEAYEKHVHSVPLLQHFCSGWWPLIIAVPLVAFAIHAYTHPNEFSVAVGGCCQASSQSR
jgi:hypothetical protein